MRVFAISDLHLSINSAKPMDIFGPVWADYLDAIDRSFKENNITDDDLVLIPGDISWAMHMPDAIADLDYISHWPGKKVLLRGNHDYWWKSISALRAVLPHNMYAIQNDAIKFGDTIICGTRGWTVPDSTHKTDADKKIYDREIIRLELSLKDALRQQQNNEDIIVIMHYPPFNIFHADSPFTNLIEKYGVKKVVFGHLHSYDHRQALVYEKNGVTYYLTSCDLVQNNLVQIK